MATLTIKQHKTVCAKSVKTFTQRPLTGTAWKCLHDVTKLSRNMTVSALKWCVRVQSSTGSASDL